MYLLTTGSSYFFSPSSGPGGTTIMGFEIANVSLYTILMTIIFLGFIVFTTTLGVYQIHKYYLNKSMSGNDRSPFLIVTWVCIGLFLVTLILAFTIIYSLWIVLFVGWAIQLFGYGLYRYLNSNQGHPFERRDLRNAFSMSTALITFILLLFMY